MATTVRTTKGPAVAKFFEGYLSHRKGPMAGQPFVLEHWQRDYLSEFFELDSRGRRVYKYGYLGIPRGNGKTPLCAGLGLLEILTRKDSPDVFAAAGSKEQARILQDFARYFVEDNDKLAQRVTPSRNFLKCEATNGVMRVLSSSGSLQHGLSISAAFIDELHAFTTQTQEEVFNAILTALHKRPDSYMNVITTAGFDMETLLGRAYEQALKLEDAERPHECLRIFRDRENGVLVYWYGIPEELADEWEDERLWRLANPASWVSIDDLRRQLHAPGFDQNDFMRLHCNMWTKSREAWLPAGLWSQLLDEHPFEHVEWSDGLEIPEASEIYVGVDVGLVHDSTAVSWACRLADGRIALRTRVFSAIEEIPHHVLHTGGRVDLEDVEHFIFALAQRYRLAEVVYDPRFFDRSAGILADGDIDVAPLEQSSAEMADAYQAFYASCKEKRVRHAGDRVLTAHVEATGADLTERGWKVRKLKGSQRIDACVASCMAVWRALGSEESLYEGGDLLVL